MLELFTLAMVLEGVGGEIYPRLVVYGTLPGFRLISEDALTCTYTSYLSCYKYPSDLANGGEPGMYSWIKDT